MGFTDYARSVVRCYLEKYIPSALRLARETRQLPDRFVWTMGSWLIHYFLEKAPRPHKRQMEEAIRQGDIHWHALPFTTHTELMDAELFRHGLSYTKQLDIRFGRKTSSAKMTDVPGHTRAMVPLLAESGVRLLHIGVNPASTVPDVPPVFLWKSEGAELVVIYEKDYGATTTLPGGMALSMNLTGDNHGPQTPDEIKKVYDRLRVRFPGADPMAGTLNEVADWVWLRRGSLPVITSEIGDTWIHGAGTDPAKVARFRVLCRLRSKWIASKKLRAGGKEDRALADNLLFTAEHTWGMDIKTHLHDWRAYSPTSLQRNLKKPNFRAVAASWREQRAYVQAALRAVPARLAPEARKELASLCISKPRAKWKSIPPKEPFHLGPWIVGLAADGSIRQLSHRESPHIYTDERHRLGGLGYQQFSSHDYRRFYRQYNTLDIDWARKDFAKPGMPAGRSAWHPPRLTEIALHSDEEVRAVLRFSAQAVRRGAPAASVIYLRPNAEGLDLRLEWREKQASRLPEAIWMSFQPRLASAAAWTFQKLGFPIDPLDVVNNGNKHLHAVDGKISSQEFSLFSLDAPLVAPGRPSLLDFNNRQPDLAAGIAFNLYNNTWGTNFPMWYADDAVFRFQLRWKNLGGK